MNPKKVVVRRDAEAVSKAVSELMTKGYVKIELCFPGSKCFKSGLKEDYILIRAFKRDRRGV